MKYHVTFSSFWEVNEFDIVETIHTRCLDINIFMNKQQNLKTLSLNLGGSLLSKPFNTAFLKKGLDSVDPDKVAHRSHLTWIYTAYSFCFFFRNLMYAGFSGFV